MKNLYYIPLVLLGATIYTSGFMIGKHSVTPPGPGTPPQDVFHDEGEWYSQDGCWKLEDGYWRPLKRCRIVRVPAP